MSLSALGFIAMNNIPKVLDNSKNKIPFILLILYFKYF